MAIWRPKPLLPVFQPDHPLAKGLVGAWFFSEKGGILVPNLVKPSHPANASGSPVWGNSQIGRELFNSTSTSYLDVADDLDYRLNAGPYAIAVGVRHGDVGSNKPLVSKWASGAAWTLQISSTLSNTFLAVHRVGGTNYTASASSANSFNIPHQVIGGWDGSNVRLFRDAGVDDIVGAAITSPCNTSTGVVRFCNYSTQTVNAFTGYFNYVLIYNRWPSKAERYELHEDPYVLIAPEIDLPWAAFTSLTTPGSGNGKGGSSGKGGGRGSGKGGPGKKKTNQGRASNSAWSLIRITNV